MTGATVCASNINMVVQQQDARTEVTLINVMHEAGFH